MKTYCIADLVFRLTGSLDDFLLRRMKAYEYAGGREPDYTLSLLLGNDSIPLPQGEELACWKQRFWRRTAEGGLAVFDHVPMIFSGVINSMHYSPDWREVRGELCSTSILQFAEEVRPFNMAGEVFRNQIIRHRGAVLHASSISFEGKGLLFTAPSGTGKSTHTALWKRMFPEQVQYLNDDSPALRMTESGPVVYGTPWSGKTEINQNLAAPVAAVIFIERGVKNRLRTISGAEAFYRTIREIVFPPVQELREQMTETLSAALSAVPAYVLECDISEEAVRTARQAIL